MTKSILMVQQFKKEMSVKPVIYGSIYQLWIRFFGANLNLQPRLWIEVFSYKSAHSVICRFRKNMRKYCNWAEISCLCSVRIIFGHVTWRFGIFHTFETHALSLLPPLNYNLIRFLQKWRASKSSSRVQKSWTCAVPFTLKS